VWGANHKDINSRRQKLLGDIHEGGLHNVRIYIVNFKNLSCKWEKIVSGREESKCKGKNQRAQKLGKNKVDGADQQGLEQHDQRRWLYREWSNF
jgi:hypothetical protein